MIQLLEIKGTSYNTRHILRIPSASEEDILKTERYLDSLKREIEAGKIDFAKAAKEYSDDRATSDNGGFFTDPASGSKRLSLRTLEDPVLYFTIDTMEVGNITKPIRFTDPREGIKVRILYYQAKYPAHRANLGDDYEKMKAATLRRKEDEILEKWFVTAKEDVFIDIDPAYDRCNPLSGK
jgi:peptidyl-prolyl cis-trans isomerase SurA